MSTPRLLLPPLLLQGCQPQGQAAQAPASSRQAVSGPGREWGRGRGAG